jgi:hypothetical protein
MSYGRRSIAQADYVSQIESELKAVFEEEEKSLPVL